MTAGIAPSLLLSQVQNTAAWALEHRGEGPVPSWRSALLAAPALEARWQEPNARVEYLRLLLSAHFATVGTFVPTDVDARIRHHAWYELPGRGAVVEAVGLLAELDAWDPREVSARVLEGPGGECISGHDGEWLAVRAGALGRALALGLDEVIEQLATRIDAELAREARVFDALRTLPGRELDALRAATVLAHNTGDLSRVVEEWPSRGALAQSLSSRFVRLGHEDPSRYDGLFALAGHVNKAVMATENHRFLVLRKARALRRGRDLLLPMGPFFDAWGEHLGRHRGLDDADKSEVLAALLAGHESDPSQAGYLRAIAGLHRGHRGGVEPLAKGVPARLRKHVAAGPLREALRLDPERFAARMVNRYRAALASYRPA